MEVAVGREDNMVKVYLEDIPWGALAEMVKSEHVTISLLVFDGIKNIELYYASALQRKDAKAKTQTVPVKLGLLAQCLGSMNNYGPNEVMLGNENFYLQKFLLDDYVLKFHNVRKANSFLKKLAKRNYPDLYDTLKAPKPFITAALTEDYTKAKDFEDFLRIRFETRHAQIVKEYENGLYLSE